MLRFLPLLTFATPVQAHTGHFGTLAGHDHWILGAGLGAIGAAAAIAWVKGKRKPETSEAAETDEPAAEDAADEAPA